MLGVRELVTFDDAVVAVATVHSGAAGLGAAADAPWFCQLTRSLEPCT